MQRPESITQHFHSSFWACVHHLNLPCDTFSSHILPVKTQWSYVEPYCSSSPAHRWTLEQDSGWLGPPVRMWWTLNYLADRRYSPPVRNRGLCLATTPSSCQCTHFLTKQIYPDSATFCLSTPPPRLFTLLLFCVKSLATFTPTLVKNAHHKTADYLQTAKEY